MATFLIYTHFCRAMFHIAIYDQKIKIVLLHQLPTEGGFAYNLQLILDLQSIVKSLKSVMMHVNTPTT